MSRKALESLGAMLKARRGDRNLRETAKDIGISPATLMRIENGHTPDIATFGKACKWLGVDPGEFLGFKQVTVADSPSRLTLSAHLRADKTPKPATVQALAKMILLAAEMRKEK